MVGKRGGDNSLNKYNREESINNKSYPPATHTCVCGNIIKIIYILMSRRLIGKSPKFEFGVCLFESNRFN